MMDATQFISNCSFAACSAKHEHARVDLFLDAKGNLADCRVATPCKPSLARSIAVARAEESLRGIAPRRDVSQLRELALCVEFALHHLQAFYHLAEALELTITEFRPRLARLTESVQVLLPIPDGDNPTLLSADDMVGEQVGQLGSEALELAQQCRRLFDDSMVRLLREDDSLPHEVLGHRPLSVCLTDESNRLRFSGNYLRIVGAPREELTRFLPAEFERGFTDLMSGGYVSSTLGRALATETMSTPAAAAAHDGLLNSLRSRTVNLSIANQWGRLVELLYATEFWTGFTVSRSKSIDDVPEREQQFGSQGNGADEKEVEHGRQMGVGWAESPYGVVVDVCENDAAGACDHQVACGPLHNAVTIAGEVRSAAKSMIQKSKADSGLPTIVEAIVRRHDLGLPRDSSYRRGQLPLELTTYRHDGTVLRRQTRNLY
jgi:hypothetical protein